MKEKTKENDEKSYRSKKLEEIRRGGHYDGEPFLTEEEAEYFCMKNKSHHRKG